MQCTIVFLAATLAGCAGHQRPSTTPDATSLITSARAEALAGDYRISGRAAGVQVVASISLDSSGRAIYYVNGSPVPVSRCDDMVSLDDGTMLVTCGTTELRLSVANGVMAPVGRLTFDIAKAPRWEYDPFACQQAPPFNSCFVPQQTLVPRGQRLIAKVAVQRVAED